MEAVKRGAGREAAHSAIKAHAMAVAKEIRAGTARPTDLLARLSRDARIGLSAEELDAAVQLDISLSGAALAQVDAFMAEVEGLTQRIPESGDFRPGEIL
jgi:Adenylosuccinate lyase C-terminus.